MVRRPFDSVRTVMLFIILATAIVSAQTQSAPQTQPMRRELGNLVMDNIPDIPKEVADRMAQYQNVRTASLADWDPSGHGMLILTRFGETLQVHAISSPGAARRQLTFLPEPVASASYSPRSGQNGFLFRTDLGGGEFYQLYWFDLNTGKSALLTDGGRSRNTGVSWSDSGAKFAFSSTKRNGTDFDIYVMNGPDPKTVRMALEAKGSWSASTWSPDETRLLVQHYVSVNESYLFVLDPATGDLKEINPTNGQKKIAYGDAAYARAGNGVYYTSDEDSEFQRLTYYDLKTGEKQVLIPRVKWDVEGIAVSRDGKWLAFSVDEGGVSRLYIAPTATPEKTKLIDLPNGVLTGLEFDYQSVRLGFSLSTAQSPSDVFSVDIKTGKLERWTMSETGGLNPDSFVTPELISYSTFDSVSGGEIDPRMGIKGAARMIPAFYYKPRDDSKKPFPVIVNIHGGPEGQATASFSSTFEYWVNELGAAVLAPNVRGSTGYGKTYSELDNGMKREDTIKDIGKLLDWIATRPELDSKRIAVIGGSYGGFMSLSTLAHFSDRLRCGVDVVGISNFITFLESTESYRRDLRRVEYGDERDPKMREFLNSISPTTNAGKITVPLFVVAGSNDPRVPASEAEQIVKAVRSHEDQVWYLVAKDEGHGFQKKTNRDFYLNAVSLFFETYLLK
jgi:dipeptidyl aminopeptidase/acylaminoacyl peptidase